MQIAASAAEPQAAPSLDFLYRAHVGAARRLGSCELGALTSKSSALWTAMQRLPERQRIALVLRYYEGASERDIAETMHCAPGTVKSLVSRGLARLREVIEDV